MIGGEPKGTYDRLKSHLSMIDKKISAQVQKRNNGEKDRRYNSSHQDSRRYDFGKSRESAGGAGRLFKNFDTYGE